MNELQRIKERAAELKLSLEALATVGKRKPKELRSLSEALSEWRDRPPVVSPELRAQLSQSQIEMANLVEIEE